MDKTAQTKLVVRIIGIISISVATAIIISSPKNHSFIGLILFGGCLIGTSYQDFSTSRNNSNCTPSKH